MGLKSTVIGFGFGAFRASGLHRLAGAATRGRGVLLTFHSVRPRAPGSSEFRPNGQLEITPDFLDEALATVRRLGFDFVSMDEALARLEGDGPPFAALTFDDGYRDTLEFALPVLERHAAPFVVFVASGFAGRAARPWWLELEEALRRVERVSIVDDGLSIVLPAATMREKATAFTQIYWALRAGSETRLLKVIGDLAASAGVDGLAIADAQFMDWDEIAALSRHPLATIGAHTVHHPMLAKWPVAVARAQMARSKAEIEARIGTPVRHFAYPVGDPTSAGPREFALARELGFASAVTTRPGMLYGGHGAHRTALPRVSVNGDWQDAGYLEVLLSGAPFALWNRGRRLNVG